ncbi:MAG: amidohydrolase [Alphaproteobacteria bacterium]
MISDEKRAALDWVEAHERDLSAWHQVIWRFAEPAWREYRSAAWYVDLLRREGFEVEEGSAGMPTAFRARWGEGRPALATYAEYDAVPGHSQEPVPYPCPRKGFHRWAAGHTDPHSALGIGALGGLLAAKAAIERHGLRGTLVFFGEPAEKVCGSKPVHAAHGYYDDLDACISFHPSYLSARANTTVWDTHCGSYWSRIYTFECIEPETWSDMEAHESTLSPHTVARAPAAIDAVCLMYTTTKYTKEAMLPHTGTWTLNEAILVAGQATSDNLPPRISQIQFAWRSPTLDMQERIFEVLENNARHVAAISHCRVEATWVTKTRVGLANHALAELTYRNLEIAGAPQFGEEAKALARKIQKNLGFTPMDQPYRPELSRCIPPQESEALVREALPEWQRNYTSDDYVDYTWHCPTARLYVGRAALKPPAPGYTYPAWVNNALGGMPASIDPMIFSASRCVGATLVDLMTQPAEVEKARAEFDERTGGGIGGKRWVAPLLPKDFRAPIHFRWPEYVTTQRGEEWWIPTAP